MIFKRKRLRKGVGCGPKKSLTTSGSGGESEKREINGGISIFQGSLGGGGARKANGMTPRVWELGRANHFRSFCQARTCNEVSIRGRGRNKSKRNSIPNRVGNGEKESC